MCIESATADSCIATPAFIFSLEKHRSISFPINESKQFHFYHNALAMLTIWDQTDRKSRLEQRQ